ncbi:MAG: hypothetical protein PVJ53_06950 [Desulfobacterales bacterium]|jgi:hypothetical protein
MPPGRITTTLVLSAFVAVTVWGCYPKRIGPSGPDGRRLTWAEMNRGQRKAHMRQTVLPIAGDIFSSWRPERYGQLDCTLCHGPGARQDHFDMPSDHLPRLSGKLLLGPEFRNHPDTTRLKLNRLVPETAGALGLKTFSLLTRCGFGCYSCHWGPQGPLFGN